MVGLYVFWSKLTRRLDSDSLSSRPVILTGLTLLFLILLLTITKEAHAERFFQSHNTWYEPVPANQPLIANSANYINRLLNNSSGWAATKDNSSTGGDWSVPIYYATADTPNTVVEVYGNATHTYVEQLGWNVVPIPSNALPAMNTQRCAGQYTDGHMVIISADRHWAWDFFAASKCNGKWSASTIRKWNLTGDGIADPFIGYPYDDIYCRVAKVPLLHGIVTYDEVVKQGVINHALAFSTWANAVATGFYPTAYNYTASQDSNQWANRLGTRYQLDPTYDCENSGLNNFEKIVCRALQTYGMIYVENGGPGGNGLYFESLVVRPESWDGIITRGLAIPLSKMRAVAPVYPTTVQTPSDTQAPLVPTGLTATAVSSSRIDLSWASSTDNVGVTGYRIYRNGSQIGTVTGTAYSSTGLSASTTYTYTVSAYDAAGNVSAQSAEVSAITNSDTATPAAPSGLSVQ